MKTLKKGKEFKRVKNSSREDMENIHALKASGWKFCDKTTWRKMRDKKTVEKTPKEEKNT